MLMLFIRALVLMCAMTGAAYAGSFATILNLPGSADGADVSTPLVDVGGTLYGSSYAGGTHYAGTLFSVDPGTGATRTLYSFLGHADGAGPNELVSMNGVLYGTVQVSNNIDGPQGYGGIFSFDPATGKLRTLHSFTGSTDGGQPNGLVSLGGQLYGTATQGGSYGAGVAFRVDPATGQETVLHSFDYSDGAPPSAGIVAFGQFLYGTTGGGSSNGTFYRLDPDSGQVSVLTNFMNVDVVPFNLVSHGDLLYGYQGVNGMTELVSLNPISGTEATIYSFTSGAEEGPPSSLMSNGSLLYGTTFGSATLGGSIFSLDPASRTLTTLFTLPGTNGSFVDGAILPNALLDVNGVFYSNALVGGLANSGTTFSFAPSTGAFSVLHDFVGLSPGQYNTAGLIAVGSKLYGTAQQGGNLSLGSVFAINPASGYSKTLHAFTGGSDGYAPFAPLLDVGQMLYGVANGYNVNSGHGVAYAISRVDDAFTPLHVFPAAPNSDDTPDSSLTKIGNRLFGTSSGGSYIGTIYEILLKPSSRSRSVSLESVGGDSIGGLTAFNGSLYGTTAAIFGVGEVFKFDPATFALSTVYSFTGGDDGMRPFSGVIVSGGMLYGTTPQGGSAGFGTVFKIDPQTGAFTLLHTFTGGADGANPYSGLVAISNML